MAEIAGLPAGQFLLAFAVISFACAVQRLSGQGFGLIAAPVMAIVAPQLMPAALLLLGMVAGFGSAALDLSSVNRSELPWGFAGRTLGAVVAAMVAAQLPFERVALLVAFAVLLAVGLSLAGLRVPIRRDTLFGAGFLAGIMGTLTAAGAPPMAMLYSREEPLRSRAMQSTFFVFGMVVSVIALVAAGLVRWPHLAFALAAVPAVLLGIAISQPISRYTSRRLVRPMALGFSTLAALVLIARTL